MQARFYYVSFNTEKVIEIFRIFDRESCGERGESVLNKIMIVFCDEYIIHINKNVDKLTTTVENEERCIGQRIRESRGEKIVAEFLIPDMGCLLQDVKSLM